MPEPDPRVAERLLPIVYEELRRLAAAHLARDRAGQTLQATDLVHEAYLRLLGSENGPESQWNGRAHFFGAAARAMRRILVDRARARGAAKRGGNWRRVEANWHELHLEDVPPEIIDLDEALERFRAEDPLKADLVELRFFGGLNLEEACAILGISPATAKRHWAYARAWLYNAMQDQPES